MGLLKWYSGKGFTCRCKRPKRRGFDPWVGKIPWGRKWQPTLGFLPAKFHRQRSLVGYSLWGLEESDMTEQLSTHIPTYQYYLTTTDHTFCLYISLSSLKNTLCGSPKKHKKGRNVLQIFYNIFYNIQIFYNMLHRHILKAIYVLSTLYCLHFKGKNKQMRLIIKIYI